MDELQKIRDDAHKKWEQKKKRQEQKQKNQNKKYLVSRGTGFIYTIENGKIIYLHHYLAEKSLPKSNDPKATKVRHKNGNKLDNNIDNLEWVTINELTEDQKYR